MAEPTYGNLPVVVDPTAWAGRTVNNPLTIDAIQNQIAAALTAFFASSAPPLAIPVYVWPDFDLDAWWKSPAIAFVLVAYRRTSYSKPFNTSAMEQERTLQYDINIEARTAAWALSGAGSVYALVEVIEQCLTGFQPAGCRNAYFTDENFPEQDPQGRVWRYGMKLNVVTMRQQRAPQFALANLAQAMFNVQPSGDQVIVPPND